MPICASSIQPRRLPSRVVKGGTASRSTTGAQNTMMEKVMPTQLNRPMVARLTPTSRSQNDSVENSSRKGRPAEKPRNSIPITRGCR